MDIIAAVSLSGNTYSIRSCYEIERANIDLAKNGLHLGHVRRCSPRTNTFQIRQKVAIRGK
jgi:hypothetical protein